LRGLELAVDAGLDRYGRMVSATPGGGR